MRLEHRLIGAGQRNLADGGRRLRLLELERALGQSQHVAPQCNGAGGHDDHLLACLDQRGNVRGKRFEPGGFELTAGRSTSRLDPILTTMRRAFAHS